MSKKQKTYTAEFKAEAIKAIEENQNKVFVIQGTPPQGTTK